MVSSPVPRAGTDGTIGTVGSTGDLSTSHVDFGAQLTRNLGPAKRNTLVVTGLAVLIGSLLGFALVSSLGFEGGWVGWAIAGAALTVFCTAAAILEWCVRGWRLLGRTRCG